MHLPPTRCLIAFLQLLVPALAGAEPEQDDFATQWAWAQSVLPELSRYQPLDLGGPPVDQLREWIPDGGSTTVYDEACRPIQVELHEGVLAGDTEVRTTYDKGTKRIQALTVQYGASITYLGPGWTDYEKDDQGRWQEVGGGGVGCMESRPGILDKVTGKAAWYDGFKVALWVKCNAPQVHTAPCEGGGERTCRSCGSLRLDVRSLSPHFGVGNMGSARLETRQSDPVDCAQPCPVNEKAKLIAKLNGILRNREFLKLGDGHGAPTVFRSRKLCQRHRKAAGRAKPREGLPCSPE